MSGEPYGLFFLGAPVLVDGSELRFREVSLARTVRLTQQFVENSLIVARTRPYQPAHGECPDLRDIGAELALTLPDYGADSWERFCGAMNLFFNPAVKKKLRSLVERAAFIFVSVPSIESYLAARAAHRLNRKLIMGMRGSALLNERYLRGRFGMIGWILHPLYLYMLGYVRGQSRAAIYVSQEMKDRFPIEGGIMAAVSDVYLPETFGGKPREYSKPAHRYLYVGHLEIVKRVDLLLKAFHRAQDNLPDDWHFDIVGSGPGETSLKKLVVELGIQDHITFHGRVEWGESLALVYQHADLVVMASITEGASRVLLEAMAFGLPVISTDVGIAPELLDESALVPVDDEEEYAKVLPKIVNNPQVLTEFSRKNWRHAQRYRDYELRVKRRAFWEKALGQV